MDTEQLKNASDDEIEIYVRQRNENIEKKSYVIAGMVTGKEGFILFEIELIKKIRDTLNSLNKI